MEKYQLGFTGVLENRVGTESLRVLYVPNRPRKESRMDTAPVQQKDPQAAVETSTRGDECGW